MIIRGERQAPKSPARIGRKATGERGHLDCQARVVWVFSKESFRLSSLQWFDNLVEHVLPETTFVG